MDVGTKFLKHLADRIDRIRTELSAIDKRIGCECPDKGLFEGHELTIELMLKAKVLEGRLKEADTLMSWILTH